MPYKSQESDNYQPTDDDKKGHQLKMQGIMNENK
jgi:hypothetical protein